MTFFAIAYALIMLSLWGGAVAVLWATTGILGGLSFASVTAALAWAFWGPNTTGWKIVGWSGRQPIFENDATRRSRND